MTASNACVGGDGAAMAAWSREMYEFVSLRARRGPRRHGLERCDYFQEGCVAAAEFLAAQGDGPTDLRRLDVRVRVRIDALYRARTRKRTIDGDGLRERVPLDAFDHGLAARPGPDRDAILDVRHALDRMPARCREAVRLAYVEHRPTAEIAALWGVGCTTVVARLREAYDRLRALVERGYGEAEARLRDAGRREGRRVVKPGLAFSGRKQANNRVDWSTWGPIPDQRKDD